MTKLKLFLLTVVLTACTLLVVIYVHRPERRLVPTDLKLVASGLFVTSQLKPMNFPYLLQRGVRTVVDIRPDGEASDQPSSTDIMRAADEMNIRFHYIPVPHGGVPDDAVAKLREVLADRSGPTVLYCRTGNRAVRTYALVEASRPDGPTADAILALTRQAGFPADDLRDEINRRVADRSHLPPDHP